MARAHRARSALLATLVAGALLLPGCTFLRSLLSQVLQPPTLSFQKADVRSVSLTGMTLDLTWKVDNPNEFGVDLAGLGYTFEVEGKRMAAGHTDKALKVAPKGTSSVTLPFEVRFAEVSDGVLALLKKTEVRWAVGGDFDFATPVGDVAVPFRKEGTAPVPRLPRVRIDGASVSNVTFSGARLEVKVALDNPNAFPLPLDALAYAVKLSGLEIGGGRVTNPSLPAGGARTLTLPLQVSFTSAGQAVYDAVRSGRVNLGLTGSLNAGPVKVPVDLSRSVQLR